MISKETLIFYGLPPDIAELVIKHKLDDNMKEQISDIHKYNIVFLFGQNNMDKNFIIGKILQLYLQNNIKVLITDFGNLEFMLNNDIPLVEYARIIIIKSVDLISKQQLDLLKILPYYYKTKCFVLDLEKNNNISKYLKDNLSWFLKIKELEV